jgi:hypothetical protein
MASTSAPACSSSCRSLVEEVLDKGIADVLRGRGGDVPERWYWTDRKVAQVTRHMRLAYQPLTRRWRLHVSPVPITGNSPASAFLNQNFDSLGDALEAIKRIGRCAWEMPPRSATRSTTSTFRFRLDVSQLPRPFQIGAVGPVRLEHLGRRTASSPGEAAVSKQTAQRRSGRSHPRARCELARDALGRGRRRGRHPRRHRADVPADAQATNNRELYERNYAACSASTWWWPCVLLLVIGWVALRLLRAVAPGQVRQPAAGQAGDDLRAGGRGAGPLIYVVSYQFVSRSIESWFDVKVEGALDAGLNLGRATLDSLANDLASKTRGASASCPKPRCAAPASRWSASATSWVRTTWCCGRARPDDRQRGQSRFLLNPERPTRSSCARCARSARSRTSRGWTKPPRPPPAARQGHRARAMPSGPACWHRAALLQVTQACRRSWSTTRWPCRRPTANTRSGRSRAKGLRRMYIGTLTLSLFLAVFGAVLLAVLLRQPARAAAARAGRRRAPGGRRRPAPKPCCRARTNWAA